MGAVRRDMWLRRPSLRCEDHQEIGTKLKVDRNLKLGLIRRPSIVWKGRVNLVHSRSHGGGGRVSIMWKITSLRFHSYPYDDQEVICSGPGSRGQLPRVVSR